MKRLLILAWIMFCCMQANADVVGLKLCPNDPFLVNLTLPRTVATPQESGAAGDLTKDFKLVTQNDSVTKHDRQVGMTIRLSSIPEAYWDKEGPKNP